MLNTIVQFSLRFRGIIISLSIIFLIYGIYIFSRSQYDVFPEFAPPQIEIQTEGSGLAPEQVETLVTQRIENVINGVPGIESIRSNSIQGLSVITLKLQSSSDIYRSRQAISERLSTVISQLPQGVEAPVLSPVTSSTGDLMSIGLTSKTLSLMELRTIADWTIKQRLLAVKGVAKIGMFGGETKQFQIQIIPERLVHYDLSIEDLLVSARRATGVRGAGFIDTDNQRIIIQTEGQFLTPDELAKTVLLHPVNSNISMNLTLGDVAKVVEAPKPPISAASVMGEPGVILNIWAQYGVNTLETTHNVELALEELRPTLQAKGVVLDPNLFRAANFIETAVHNVKLSLLIGAILVAIVLSLFLFNFRTAAISCTAIPLSLLGAVVALEYMGLSLNTMTLGGLAIAIGEVVDDAVIDVENILRRLRENLALKNPRSTFQVVLDASLEVRSAVVYATMVVILIFVPVLTLSGLGGRFFSPLGLAYIFSISTSLLVALTVTPALCFTLLHKQDLEEKEVPLVQWLKAKYRLLLLRVEKNSKWVVRGVIIFTATGCLMVPFFGGGFLPEFREGHFIIHMTALPGTSIQESLRIGRQVTLALLKIPYVRSVAQRVGRAAVDEVFGTHSSELEVDLKPMKGDEAESAQLNIRKTLEQFAGVNFAINTFLMERIEETLSGYTASVVINVFGNDLDLLDKKSQEIASVLEKTPGAVGVQIQSPPGTPQLSIQLRKDSLAYWGFEPVEVLDAIRTAYEGDTVGQVYDGNRVFEVSAILDPQKRKSVTEVGALPLRSPTGSYVRLRELAKIHEASGRYIILHEGARRVQTVTCNVAGRDAESFVKEAKKQILSKIDFPEGTYAQFSGVAQAQAQSKRDLLLHSFMAVTGILLLLSIVIGSPRNLILILANLPFALVGGVIVIFLSGSWLSLGSLVGFVTLFGITIRNSIMLVTHYEHLVTVEGMTWGPETAILGASQRLTPILMTALVTALGLLPLAMGSGSPGREIEGPMALVILGGLITSTILNLLVLPTLALRIPFFLHNSHRTR